jgi:hypothetical protein
MSEIKPKRIEDANQSAWILGWDDDGPEYARSCQWIEKKNQWCNIPDGDRFESGFQPKYFIYLASLNTDHIP